MKTNYLSDEFYYQAKKDLKKRLASQRYEHSISASEMARELAQAYGVNVGKARIAGLLHDWDKEYSDEDIQSRALQLKVDVDPLIQKTMPRLLHGHTGAVSLAGNYPGIDSDILQAIARHTSAAIGMSDLDMVVYIADAIEPLRSYSSMDDIRQSIGEVSLESLFLMTFKHIFLVLIERNKRIHPNTGKVWNYYCDKLHPIK